MPITKTTKNMKSEKLAKIWPSQITRPRRRKSHVICEGRLLLQAHTEIAYSFTRIRVNYN